MKGFTGIITLFIGITIAVIMVANIVLPTVFNVNQSYNVSGTIYNWDAGSIALWGVLGIAIIGALILMILA